MIKFFFLIFLFFSTINFANEISTIKINYIIENSNNYNDFLSKFESHKESISKFLVSKENKILKSKKYIENSTAILTNEEINNLVKEYENTVRIFENDVFNFNSYYQENLDLNKNIVLDNIVKLVTKYADENNINLILNENNYFISSDNIDITDFILKKLNNINFILTFEEFNFD